jgi:hypothetical protein
MFDEAELDEFDIMLEKIFQRADAVLFSFDSSGNIVTQSFEEE